MPTFPVSSIESAPDASKPALREFQAAFGIVPNIAAAMATSSVLINSLVVLFKQVHTGTFTEQQIQAVLLTNAVTNACNWAVAFHTELALRNGVNQDDVSAIRNRLVPKDQKLAALSSLARRLIETRGRLADEDMDNFLATGFAKDQLLEVIAIVAASTITNYTGNVTKPPVEAPFNAHSWSA
jgi:AhpD family alkylhydroperoxidase